MLALYYGMRGEYAEALVSARTGLQIAEEIGHRQWTSASLVTLGTVLSDIRSFDQAREILDMAVQLARETGSQHWLRLAAGSLAECAIGQGDLQYAREVLDSVLGGESPLQTMGQRRVGVVRVQLALAEGEADLALRRAERLFATAPGLNEEADPPSALPRLAMFHAEALLMMGRYTEAEAEMGAVAYGIERLDAWSLRGKLCLLKGRLYTAMKMPDEAARAYSSARKSLDEIATHIPDDDLRARFLEDTGRAFPEGADASNEAQSTKRDRAGRPGGLTTREWEVAKLAASGKTNREIAEALVLGTRTVESHIGNELSKLGFSSRSQLAAWLVGVDNEDTT
jgi:ATP/maltotriose-dependent transcriptional regulator MalT